MTANVMAPGLRRVDVAALAREVAVPAPAALQLRVDDWLEALRDENGCIVDRARFDPLDALRSQLLVRGSSALASAAVAQELGARHAGDLVFLQHDSTDAPVGGIIGRAPQHPLVTLPSVATWGLGARDMAYILRREIRSLLHASRADSRPNGKHRPVLALARELVHLSDLLPLATELSETHGVSTLFVATTAKIEARLRDSGHTPLRIDDWSARPPNAFGAVTLAGLRAARRANSLARKGHPRFTHIELEALSDAARRVLLRGLWDLRRIATAMARLAARVRPRLLLVGNPYTLEGRVSAHVARANGVPSAAIQHGAIIPGDPRWRHCPVDRLCVWGETSRQALLSCGAQANTVEVTGSPRLDSALSNWRSAAFAPGQPGSVLVATSGPGDLVSPAQHREFIAMLYEAAARVPELRVVVKLHPKDREEHYTPAAAQWPAARVNLTRGDASRHGLDIYDFLKVARALVTISSTTALDAMAAGVPVIAVELGDRPASVRALPFLNPPLAHCVRNAVELGASFRNALEPHPIADTTLASTYAGQYFANPGRSVQQTARALLELSLRAGE